MSFINVGYDASGNGNNWTSINIDENTTGTNADVLVDVPTPWGTDTGVGGEVRGNYATVNAIGYRTTTPTPTITNGNLDVVCPSGSASSIGTANFGVSSGKWYWEVTKTGTAYGNTGIVLTPFNMAASSSLDLGGLSNEYVYVNSGSKFNNNSSSSYGASWTNGDVIGVALDLDAGTLVFYKNGTSQGTAFSSLPSGTYLVGGYDSYNGSGFVFNFGQRSFAYAAPTGFKALCTQNLPEPTVVDGSQYMDVDLWTGNGTGQSITTPFAPDFVWIKARNQTYDNQVWDRLRGPLIKLATNQTAAESSLANSVTSFNSNGYTLGDTATVNLNTGSFVGWAWKAGGTGVSNTAGTITSTVSANTTAGFSIATYTGNGSAGATFGHGLGATPSMVIVKWRDGADDWCVYNKNLTTSRSLWLNSTSAQLSSGYFGFFWNNTDPTSTLVTLGSNGAVNGSSRTYVAYCFAPVESYSAFGSYVGNGSSTDGPFVFCGFRPRFILFKKSNDAGDWNIRDTSRSPYNVVGEALYPNLSFVEYSGTETYIDILSNGFKLRGNWNSTNASGGTYIYAAFAENPFKYSLAR